MRSERGFGVSLRRPPQWLTPSRPISRSSEGCPVAGRSLPRYSRREDRLSMSKEGLRLLVTIEVGEDGYIVAECPAVPGCMSQGRTREEALENIKDAILACVEVRKRRGLPLTVETQEVEVAV